GQPQQRPPNLSSNPGLVNQFRPQFPAYPMPPRNVNVLQQGGFLPGLQPNNHRTPGQAPQVQSMTPQPTPGFMPSRGQGMHAFGGALGQHQTTSVLQQQMQSQQSNGTTQSVTSSDAVSLDPNDFPALGSASTTNATGSSNNGATGNGTSYASQAGTGVQLGGSGGVGSSGSGGVGGGAANANQPRDFTPDDFPALGGQSQSHNQNSSHNQNPGQESHSHPPGLNGFQHSDHSQQHRQNLLGALSGNIPPGTPGMLNLGGTQTRNVHPGFQQGQGDVDKQQQHQRSNYPLKLNPSSHAAWNSPNPNPSATSANSNTNGAHSQSISAHLNAPPSVPSPSGGPFPQTPGLGANGGAATQSTPFPSNGATQGDSHATAPSHPPSNPNTSTNQNTSSLQNSSTTHQPHPQTPAQQILISPADRWGLLGLLEMIKNAGTDVDGGLSSMGTDLGTMGLDMNYPGSLYPTFITPWADQSAAHSVEPDFNLPACYLSVQAPPPGPQKAMGFSDETLFFMFYSSPRDALQEVAAQELFNRNWRFHKDLRLWITKETGSSPSQKLPGGEQGRFTFWDPENWCKERKNMTMLYTDLEEKTVPAFASALTLVPANQSQNIPQQQQVQSQLNAGVQAARGSFQMGMASL
ncbi:General negative regulator of transcription subunit 2, partial [Leucoagaricus sp. SymC.cos]